MRLGMLLAVACCVLTACGSSGPEERLGDPAVYQRIESLTDCADVQEEFDVAAVHNEGSEPGTERFEVTLEYMKAAQDRLEELECFG